MRQYGREADMCIFRSSSIVYKRCILILCFVNFVNSQLLDDLNVRPDLSSLIQPKQPEGVANSTTPNKCGKINDFCDESMPCCEDHWCVKIPLSMVKGICLEKRNAPNAKIENKESAQLTSDRPSWAKLIAGAVSRDELASSIPMNNFNLLPMSSDLKRSILTKSIMNNVGKIFSTLGSYNFFPINSERVKAEGNNNNTKVNTEINRENEMKNPGNENKGNYTEKDNLQNQDQNNNEAVKSEYLNIPIPILQLETQFTEAVISNNPVPVINPTINNDRPQSFNRFNQGFFLPILKEFDVLRSNQIKYLDFMKTLHCMCKQKENNASPIKQTSAADTAISNTNRTNENTTVLNSRELADGNVNKNTTEIKYDVVIQEKLETTVSDDQFEKLEAGIRNGEIKNAKVVNVRKHNNINRTHVFEKNPKENRINESKKRNSSEVVKGDIKTTIYIPENANNKKWKDSDFDGATIVHEALFDKSTELTLETKINIVRDSDEIFKKGANKLNTLKYSEFRNSKNKIDYIDQDEENLYGRSNENYETKQENQREDKDLLQLETENTAAIAETDPDTDPESNESNLEHSKTTKIGRKSLINDLDANNKLVKENKTELKDIPESHSWEFIEFKKINRDNATPNRNQLNQEQNQEMKTKYVDNSVNNTSNQVKLETNNSFAGSPTHSSDDRQRRRESKDVFHKKKRKYRKVLKRNGRHSENDVENYVDSENYPEYENYGDYDYNDNLKQSIREYEKNIEDKYNVTLIPQYSIFIKDNRKDPIGKIDFQIKEKSDSKENGQDYQNSNDNTRNREHIKRKKENEFKDRNNGDYRANEQNNEVKQDVGKSKKEKRKMKKNKKIFFSKKLKHVADNLLLMVLSAKKNTKPRNGGKPVPVIRKHDSQLYIERDGKRKPITNTNKFREVVLNPGESITFRNEKGKEEEDEEEEEEYDDSDYDIYDSKYLDSDEYYYDSYEDNNESLRDQKKTARDLEKIENKIVEIDHLFDDMLASVGETLAFIRNDHVRLPRSESSKLKSLLAHIKRSKVQLRYKIVTAQYSFGECLKMIRYNYIIFETKKNKLLDGIYKAEEKALEKLDELEMKVKKDLEKEIEYYELLEKVEKEERPEQPAIDYKESELKLEVLKRKILGLYAETRIILRRYLTSLKGYLNKRGFYKDRLKERRTKRPYFWPKKKSKDRAEQDQESAERLFRYATDPNFVPPVTEKAATPEKVKKDSEEVPKKEEEVLEGEILPIKTPIASK